MAKTDKPYTNGLAVYGKAVRFSNAPNGQNLRLVDGKAVWTLDGLLGDFEGKEICVTVKLGKRKHKAERKWNATLAAETA